MHHLQAPPLDCRRVSAQHSRLASRAVGCRVCCVRSIQFDSALISSQSRVDNINFRSSYNNHNNIHNHTNGQNKIEEATAKTKTPTKPNRRIDLKTHNYHHSRTPQTSQTPTSTRRNMPPPRLANAEEKSEKESEAEADNTIATTSLYISYPPTPPYFTPIPFISNSCIQTIFLSPYFLKFYWNSLAVLNAIPVLFALFICFHQITVVRSAPIQSSSTTNLISAEEDEQTIATIPEGEEDKKEMRKEKLKSDFEFVRKQLELYGYLRGNPSLHEFTEALKIFQGVLGVEETGEVDEPTILAASKPRCSQTDVIIRSKRSRRYTISKLGKWDRKHYTGDHSLHLKWYISTYTNDINRGEIRSTARKAFDLWTHQSQIKNEQKVTITFSEASSRDDADINILWAEGAHGDNHNFDGAHGKIDAQNRKENVLAHTFFPAHEFPLNGDIHFDDAETWDNDVSAVDNGRRFFPYVIAHEIGHALGLMHSRKFDALMYPYYKSVPLEEIILDVDDKCGVNWNYGGPSNFCLFVWLMSEVIDYPEIAPPSGGQREWYYNEIWQYIKMWERRQITDGVSLVKSNKTTKNRNAKAQKLPRCTSAHDRLKASIEEKLNKLLDISGEEGKKYSVIVCNFLAGLHMYRGSPQYSYDESIEKEFKGVHNEVMEFTNGAGASVKAKRMIRDAEQLEKEGALTIFDPEYFNKEFFDSFFAEYNK